jgi:allose kinase
MYALGVDIGGTNLRIGLIDKEYNVFHFKKVLQREVLQDNPIVNLSDYIKDYFLKCSIQENQILGICLALPATISKTKDVVLNAPNIRGFNGLNVKQIMEENTGLPVFIEKDVNALLVHDLHNYELNSSNSIIIGCYVGTGLGNSICINGTILSGYNGVAGELGHIPVWGRSDICGCGNEGCVETYVGGKYLNKLQEISFPTTSIENLFKEHSETRILDEYLKDLARTIASEINILDPEYVVLGGGVLSMKEFPYYQLIKYIKKYTRKPLPENNLKFVHSENTGVNGTIGAGILVWENTER